jgi:hypothetical protein
LAHHLLAYVEMLARDEERMTEIRARTNRLPLGSAALAGTTYPLDRARVATTLGMVNAQGEPQLCQNSLDAVSDRDFAIEFTAAASLCMVHISRLSEELIIWMSQNFAFIQLADRFTTGSSIMPQKKNPDVPELARGKTGRVVGHLMGLITLMKGQPLAYNKDNQEDKEPLFDTVDTLKDTLRIFAEMIGGQTTASGAKEGGLTVHASPMEAAAKKGFATATDLADYLVKKGLPFRDAQELSPLHREGCLRLFEPARFFECPQHLGGHRTGPSPTTNCATPTTAGLNQHPTDAHFSTPPRPDHWRRFRWTGNRKGLGRCPRRHHLGGQNQPPLVPTPALPSGHRGIGSTSHCRPYPQFVSAPSQSDHLARRSHQHRCRRPSSAFV